jgi:hypothetical protein
MSGVPITRECSVEDTAVKIVASGEAGDNRRLWIHIEPGQGGCAPTAALQHRRPTAAPCS